MQRPWLSQYQEGVPHEINPEEYASLVELFERACQDHSKRCAYTNFGSSITYAELEQQSRHFALSLLNLGLKRGDRVALMMPNSLQYPVALFGILRAGLVVVNTNPLYTPSEIIHQMNDSGSSGIVVMANFAHVLEQALPSTTIKHVIITELGDLFPCVKRILFNAVVKYIKKMVPPYSIPQAIRFRYFLQHSPSVTHTLPTLKHEDLAFLQYTGGTTGVSKGAMLTHGNMVSNVLQASAWIKPLNLNENDLIITALPLYHIFSLTANCLLFIKIGATNSLITNPRDTPHFIKTLKHCGFSAITGVNTLFNTLLNHPQFSSIDFSKLKIALSGGMALQKTVSLHWHEVTHSKILEAYGLTETSPAVTINPIYLEEYNRLLAEPAAGQKEQGGSEHKTGVYTRVHGSSCTEPTQLFSSAVGLCKKSNGSIGLPLPSTDLSIRNEQNEAVKIGEQGELCVKGPQVMPGYWQRPDETAQVFTRDGYLKTGDIAYMDEQGFFYLVDRKKDLILISGFNVYPNEIEQVISQHPGVLEVGVIGVSSKETGEMVKACVVKRDPALTEDDVLNHCRLYLTPYKIPKIVEFYAELPKTNVGKILRRALR